MSNYYENLIETVINNSVATNWITAIYEWNIVDCEEDKCRDSRCICGKENIKYLYTIKNCKNGKQLYPIGSTCIKKFDRDELNEITSLKEALFKLLHAVENNEFISLKSRLFSKKILEYLYNENAFKANCYNRYDGYNDYEFILKMFKKRNDPSEKEEAKIRAIIVSSIKPFLVKQLKNKVLRK